MDPLDLYVECMLPADPPERTLGRVIAGLPHQDDTSGPYVATWFVSAPAELYSHFLHACVAAVQRLRAGDHRDWQRGDAGMWETYVAMGAPVDELMMIPDDLSAEV